MGCAVPTANWAQSSLGFFPFLLPDVVPELLACPSAWLGDPNSPSSAKDAAQDRSSCPCHPGLPHSCRDRTQGAENKVGCASRCSVTLLSPPHAVTWQDRGWHRPLCHSSASSAALQAPLAGEAWQGDDAEARDGCDGLCTTHTSQSRAGSEAGLDTSAKTSRESSKAAVPGSCSHQGSAACPGSGDGSWQGQELSIPSSMPALPSSWHPQVGAAASGGDAQGWQWDCSSRPWRSQWKPQSHSPTLTSCGAGGVPRARLGRETLGDT